MTLASTAALEGDQRSGLVLRHKLSTYANSGARNEGILTSDFAFRCDTTAGEQIAKRVISVSL